MNSYFVCRGAKIIGPLSASKVVKQFDSGRLRAADLISSQDDGPWGSLGEAYDDLLQVVESGDGHYGLNDDEYGVSLPKPKRKAKKKESPKEPPVQTLLILAGLSVGILFSLVVAGIFFWQSDSGTASEASNFTNRVEASSDAAEFRLDKSSDVTAALRELRATNAAIEIGVTSDELRVLLQVLNGKVAVLNPGHTQDAFQSIVRVYKDSLSLMQLLADEKLNGMRLIGAESNNLAGIRVEDGGPCFSEFYTAEEKKYYLALFEILKTNPDLVVDVTEFGLWKFSVDSSVQKLWSKAKREIKQLELRK